jgi:ubiquinone/menaquinone biosynthesis C-methylase UbiE
MRSLSVEEARAFYDRFGVKQDQQLFYEGPALATLVANACLAEARSVFEYGCGTGRFAQELLEHHLQEGCRYLGVDISSTMVRLAAKRLIGYAGRASVVLSSGEATVAVPDSSIDRFISTYVLDLLPEPTSQRVIAEAHRVLSADGLLCLVGVTHGVTPLSRLVMSIWLRLFAWKPSLVGGCRPTRLVDLLLAGQWQVVSHNTVVAWGVASEVVIAKPIRAEYAA